MGVWGDMASCVEMVWENLRKLIVDFCSELLAEYCSLFSRPNAKERALSPERLLCLCGWLFEAEWGAILAQGYLAEVLGTLSRWIVLVCTVVFW